MTLEDYPGADIRVGDQLKAERGEVPAIGVRGKHLMDRPLRRDVVE